MILCECEEAAGSVGVASLLLDDFCGSCANLRDVLIDFLSTSGVGRDRCCWMCRQQVLFVIRFSDVRLFSRMHQLPLFSFEHLHFAQLSSSTHFTDLNEARWTFLLLLLSNPLPS